MILSLPRETRMERPLDNLILGLAAVSIALAGWMPACTVLRDLDDLAAEPPGGAAADAGLDQDAGETEAGSEEASGSDAGDGGLEPTWWRPTPGTTWQYQLSGALDPSFDVAMYGIDLFEATDADFVTLHADQRIVICYFSAGTYEPWRDDEGEFAPSDLGSAMDDFPDERWIDVRSSTVRAVMLKRLDKARDRGCDGVAPANVDGFAYDTVFDMTASDQVDYNRFLMAAGHQRGLSVGLQNAVGLVKDMLDDVDWVLDAECVGDLLCSLLEPVIAANKAVFHIEYVDDVALLDERRAEVCGLTMTQGFSTIIKLPALDAWRATCD